MDINNEQFKKFYEINDNDFIDLLNSFDTFSKIVDLRREDIISKDKMKSLY